jgi:hypothetical protein
VYSRSCVSARDAEGRVTSTLPSAFLWASLLRLRQHDLRVLSPCWATVSDFSLLERAGIAARIGCFEERVLASVNSSTRFQVDISYA